MDDNTPTKPMSRKEIIAAWIVGGGIMILFWTCLAAGLIPVPS